jgi:hypothetical protein
MALHFLKALISNLLQNRGHASSTSGMAWAQGQTSSGTLTVRAELASSINLIFLTDSNGVALTGSGTNVATLDFGAVSQFTPPPPKVTQTVAATSFTVSTPFDVSVTKSNVTSANYTLSAELQTTDAVNGRTIDTFPLTTVPVSWFSLKWRRDVLRECRLRPCRAGIFKACGSIVR